VLYSLVGAKVPHLELSLPGANGLGSEKSSSPFIMGSLLLIHSRAFCHILVEERRMPGPRKLDETNIKPVETVITSAKPRGYLPSRRGVVAFEDSIVHTLLVVGADYRIPE